MMGCSAEGETEGFININDQSSGNLYILLKSQTIKFIKV